MIYKTVLLYILFLTAATASQRLDFTTKESAPATTPPEEYKYIPVYTLQILSTKTIPTAHKILKKLPPRLRKDVKLYKAGNFIASRYSKAPTPKALKDYIETFKKYGFNDAYIVKTTKWHMLHNAIFSKNDTEEKKTAPAQKKSYTLSQYDKSQTLIKADKAYKSGDDSMAILYYEILLNADAATSKIKNNLCYLYGKKGAWFDAKKIIDKERYIPKLLYAYAYGALETNQDNFIQSLGKYILLDRSGRLALLAGAYYEKRGDIPRALSYYKLSYEKNPSDVYNIFAFARALDLNRDHKNALKYYKEALRHINENGKLQSAINRRIIQLSEILQ